MGSREGEERDKRAPALSKNLNPPYSFNTPFNRFKGGIILLSLNVLNSFPLSSSTSSLSHFLNEMSTIFLDQIF